MYIYDIQRILCNNHSMRTVQQIEAQIRILEKKLLSVNIDPEKYYPLIGKIKKLREELKQANWNEHLGR